MKPATSLDNLPATARAILYQLALCAEGRGRTALHKHLQQCPFARTASRAISIEEVDNWLTTLERACWLTHEQAKRGWTYRLPPDQRNTVLLHLFNAPEGPLCLNLTRRYLTTLGTWNAPGPELILQGLWCFLLDGDLKELQRCINRYAPRPHASESLREHPAFQLLETDEAGTQLFQQLPAAIQCCLLTHYLRNANRVLAPATKAYEQGLALIDRQYDDDLALELLLQAFWRGDWPHLEALSHPSFTVFGQVIIHSVRGEAGEALNHLEAWRAQLRKQTGQRNPVWAPVLNSLYTLALIGAYEPSRRHALKQALTQGEREHRGYAYPVLEMFHERLQGAASRKTRGYLPSTLNGLDGLMLALGHYWLDSNDTPAWQRELNAYCQSLVDAGYSWLAAEFDALLEKQFGQPRQLAQVHQAAGLRPLVQLHQRQESWQLALQALRLLKAPATQEQAAPRATRLAWLVSLGSYYDQVEPREQKRNAKGQWSKGRVVALQRLVNERGSLDFLNEQDRQAISRIQVISQYSGYERYELPIHEALPALVGHPALYWANQPDLRFDLVLGQVALHLEEANGRLRLHLSPGDVDAHERIVIVEESPTRVVIYPTDPDIRQLASIVGMGLEMPLSAKQELLEVASTLAPLLPIHSDLPELATQVPTVDADGTLHAHLVPLEQGLRLQLLVRPLAEGNWLRPGQGSAYLLGEQAGQPVQARRDLDAERQALQQVLDSCPGLALGDTEGHEWRLADPQDALQVLGELKALEGQGLRCVWPEGGQIHHRGRAGFGQLRLGLKQQGNWLRLQGELRLDDGKVLELRKLLDLLKDAPGRFVHLGERDWLALDDRLRRQLDELRHQAERLGENDLLLSPLSAPLLEALAGQVEDFKADRHWQGHLDRLASMRAHQPQVPRTLLTQLREYQHEGFCWLSRLAHWGVGACLADDMGLGKTVQLLALLLERAGQGPQLVVAPTSVTLNWQAECARFAPSLKVRLYHEDRRLEALGPRDLVIVSYGLLQQDSEAFAAQHWTSAVLDEAQAIKNAQTKRSQAAMALQADFRAVATGTPLENHLGELWNLFRFINPGLLGSQESCDARFATPIERGDVSARRALRKLIQPFLLRRLKSQVLEELPPRTEITYRVPLSTEETHLYEALRQQALSNLEAPEGGSANPVQMLAEITRLRRFCCHPSLSVPGSTLEGSKLQAFAEITEELLASGHRALVFSQFVDHLQIVRRWVEHNGITYQYLDGATPAKERRSRVEAFQAGQGDLFLISLKAGGSGLNLTAADYVIHLDPWWNPAVEDQASDRAHRMGQQRPVTVYRLVAEHTIEEQIVALHQRKRDLADNLLEGGEMSARLDAEALLRLLRGESA
ncbi:DEAD/DEAH box helicase [Metapseudomonas otitidis]|uniref:DEAD/DEAH box helicase n=1 Tax=Metapseudomonas otitidis TaxID=319939 RepID=UPI0013F65E9A|nr:DEAD/DEAH box helicase [Pseudomonas otitidis]